MFHFVKEALQVYIHYVLIALIDVVLRPVYGLLCVALWAKSVAMCLELHLEPRHHCLMHRLLQQAVFYRGNAQQAGLPIALGYCYPQYGLASVASITHRGHQLYALDPKVFGKLVGGHAIHSCRTFVRHHVGTCLFHVAVAKYLLNHYWSLQFNLTVPPIVRLLALVAQQSPWHLEHLNVRSFIGL